MCFVVKENDNCNLELRSLTLKNDNLNLVSGP